MSRRFAAGIVPGLFPPQRRDLSMPVEVDLSPKAAEKVAREAAVQSFDNAARSVGIDWCTPLDGKQVQRWSEKLAGRVVEKRQEEVKAYERGERQPCKQNDPQLLVIEIDGGRVQNRLKNEEGSRWREDKLVTVSTALPGNPTAWKKEDREATMLVTTHVATMGDAKAIGKLARRESRRRSGCCAAPNKSWCWETGRHGSTGCARIISRIR
jgi:hypothetical protein